MSVNFPFLDLGGPQGTDVYGREEGYLYGKYMQRTGAAVVLGQALLLDTIASATETTTYANESTSVQGNAVSPTANFIKGLQAGAVLVVTSLLSDAGADNKAVECAIWGQCKGLCYDPGTGIAIGEEMTVTTTGYFDADLASYERVFAIARGASTAATSSTVAVLLDLFLDNQWTITSGVASQGASGKTLIS